MAGSRKCAAHRSPRCSCLRARPGSRTLNHAGHQPRRGATRPGRAPAPPPDGGKSARSDSHPPSAFDLGPRSIHAQPVDGSASAIAGRFRPSTRVPEHGRLRHECDLLVPTLQPTYRRGSSPRCGRRPRRRRPAPVERQPRLQGARSTSPPRQRAFAAPLRLRPCPGMMWPPHLAGSTARYRARAGTCGREALPGLAVPPAPRRRSWLGLRRS